MKLVGDQYNGTGTKTINRTQRKYQQTLALRMPVCHPGIEDFQKKSEKAVYRKIPKPNHKFILLILFRVAKSTDFMQGNSGGYLANKGGL